MLMLRSCRFWPSCSVYAESAWRTYGWRRGTILTVRRLGRCHPWGGHGIDPLP
ncbi:MAG: membrane protein insertion efficiency factor YidD [Candidatus Omnitrophica bacterium]|nr:membrane protein insertion efficiency factor YidD [Candidatus Omnitrophota bacterium]